MDAKLVVIGGKASKRQVSLNLPTVIGRSRDADLTVAHPMVSRQHCELFDVNGLLRVRDLGSLNGTYVGKERVREADLYPNDEITVGPLTFRIKYRFVGEIASAPKVLPASEPPEPDGGEQAVQVEPVDVEPASGARPGAPQADEVAEVEGQPGIAPTDGAMPDFAAWDAIDSPPSEPVPSEQPPPPLPFDRPAGVEKETEMVIGQGEEPLSPVAPDERPPIEVVPIDEAEAENGRETACWDEIPSPDSDAAEDPDFKDASDD